MPELPEVQTIVTALQPLLQGQKMAAARLLRSDIVSPPRFDLPAHLGGRRIFRITRRGKKIVFALDDGNRFYIHLGMTGRLTVQTRSAPMLAHTHFLVDFASVQLRFVDPRRFGGIFWLGADAKPDAGLGPEPLTLRPAALALRLGRTTRAVKSALLDQSLIAGLGNIYVDEALFAAAIHPLTPADELSSGQVNRLNRAIKLVLRRALRHRGSTLRDYRDANGNPGDFQHLHRVYDRTGKPCSTCRTPVARLVIGGRSSHFCPKCQIQGGALRRLRVH